jgi:hypothetical protein
MTGKVYRTKPDAETEADEILPTETHTVPGLMTEVKLQRGLEKLRRERDKILESIENENERIKRTGTLGGNSVLKVLKAKLAEKDEQLEAQIEKMIANKGEGS